MNQHLIISAKRIVRSVGLVTKVANVMGIICLILLGNAPLSVETGTSSSRRNAMTTTLKMETVVPSNARWKMSMLASMSPQNVIYN